MKKQVKDTIIEERNQEIRQLEKDLEDLSQIHFDLSLLINSQGEKLDYISEEIEVIEKNVEEGTKSLEKVETGNKNIWRNVGIVAGSLTAGALGFIGGPIIGSITLLSGAIAGTGIVLIV